MTKERTIRSAVNYLLSCIDDGVCREFHQLRHGPSLAYSTACIGSTLAEFGLVPDEMIETVLSLQRDNGGWSYNRSVPADADSTLRAIQFLQKVGLADIKEVQKAKQFVASHQKESGGIATYLEESIAAMGYSGNGWADSHPCVTALAAHVLQGEEVGKQAMSYTHRRIREGDTRSYWWKTPWYVRYEAGCLNGEDIKNDPVEAGLALLLMAENGVSDWRLTENLADMQGDDGSFPATRQFRIPRPHQLLHDLTGDEEVVEDQRRTFSTAAAVTAIARQARIT